MRIRCRRGVACGQFSKIVQGPALDAAAGCAPMRVSAYDVPRPVDLWVQQAKRSKPGWTQACPEEDVASEEANIGRPGGNSVGHAIT